MTMRIHFTEALQNLEQEIVKMSTLVEEAIQRAVDAFENKDTDTASKIIEGDEVINKLHISIEDTCTMLLATEQPVASDLRRIITVIKIASNLERVGDHAVHLSQTTIRLAQHAYIDRVTGLIPHMAEIGLAMIRDAIDSFVQRDVEKAKRTADLDEKIDELHRKLFGILIDSMKEDKKYIEQATDLLFINRFMERLGDHVANICEWVVYSITGRHMELNR